MFAASAAASHEYRHRMSPVARASSFRISFSARLFSGEAAQVVERGYGDPPGHAQVHPPARNAEWLPSRERSAVLVASHVPTGVPFR